MTHMVSCYEFLEDEKSIEHEEMTFVIKSSKTKEEKIVVGLCCLSSLLVVMKCYNFPRRCELH